MILRSFDWAVLFKALAERNGWTPGQVLHGVTVPQLWLMYGFGTSRRFATPRSILDAVNRKRAAKGLSPISPKKKLPKTSGRNRRGRHQ